MSDTNNIEINDVGKIDIIGKDALLGKAKAQVMAMGSLAIFEICESVNIAGDKSEYNLHCVGE